MFKLLKFSTYDSRVPTKVSLFGSVFTNFIIAIVIVVTTEEVTKAGIVKIKATFCSLKSLFCHCYTLVSTAKNCLTVTCPAHQY